MKIDYRKCGDYFIPNLVLGNEEYKNYQIGKYGYLRLDYLRNYKKAEYELMRINCSLRKHIIEIDLQAKEKVKLLINQFKETENISESLKDTNPLEWVGKMNNIKNKAEEIILKEINNLPSPQRNRVYLKIIKDYKNAEIANCENVDKSAVTRSLKVGIEKIFKKYKKF